MARFPMGLKIIPSAFSRVAMSGLNYDSCFIYLEDLIIFGNTREAHNRNLIKFSHLMRNVNLKLNPNICEFLKRELMYLGYIILAKGILPDPEKVKVN